MRMRTQYEILLQSWFRIDVVSSCDEEVESDYGVEKCLLAVYDGYQDHQDPIDLLGEVGWRGKT